MLSHAISCIDVEIIETNARMYTVTANYHKMDVEVEFNQSFGKKGVCLILSLPNVAKGKFRRISKFNFLKFLEANSIM